MKQVYNIRDGKFWIDHTSFEGYTYLLFIRTLFLIMGIYLLFFFLVSILFWLFRFFVLGEKTLANNQNNHDYLMQYQNVFLTVTFSIIICFGMNNFRGEIQLKFIFYKKFIVGDRDLGYLKNRTVLLKFRDRVTASPAFIMDTINTIFKSNCVNGRLIMIQFLPDFKKLF